eukprot:gb/GFBE01050547.1/.p1 GENE.gb/GFBE01050547.1/~~gb/GFBE01050547.1/.p1  ORF type:complete len:149 (+),score=19.75 gb/GFBE01050547.1/:1-447(+)
MTYPRRDGRSMSAPAPHAAEGNPVAPQATEGSRTTSRVPLDLLPSLDASASSGDDAADLHVVCCERTPGGSERGLEMRHILGTWIEFDQLLQELRTTSDKLANPDRSLGAECLSSEKLTRSLLDLRSAIQQVEMARAELQSHTTPSSS